MAKIATIKNFSNMGDNGVYYLEGMVARKMNNSSVLTPNYILNYAISEATTDFSGFTALVRNGVSFKHISSENGSTLLLNKDGKIFDYNIVVAGSSKGLIHTVANSATPNPDSAPLSFSDIVVTKNEHILYPTQEALGIGYRGIVKAGSGTTSIIDTAGRNFTTLGISTIAGSNKVYNFNNKEEYTITSITTTTATNDTLNFSAGSSNDAGEIFMVFSDIGANNGGIFWNFFTSTAHPQYVGQQANSNFRRQIVLFDDEYLIGNGNNLASLNVNETTWDDNHKQLPDNTEFFCMSVNQDRILIGASKRGKGVLLLWDGYSDGWLAIEELEQVPTCIKEYDSGWIVLMGDAIYYSNGYQTKKMAQLPDIDELFGNTSCFYNSILTFNEKILLALSANTIYRSKTGLWLYEPGSGWTVIPTTNNSGNNLGGGSSLGAIFSVVDFPTNINTVRHIYVNFSDAKGTNTVGLNKLLSTYSLKYSSMFYIALPKKVNISQIQVNLSPQFRYGAGTGATTISLAIGDGNNELWRSTMTGANSTSTLLTNPTGGSAYQAGKVGHQIRILDGNLGGQRSYITSIANAGTASEALTISPALSASPATGITFNMNALKLVESKSFTTVIPDQLPFTLSTGFYGDKLYLEIYIDASSGVRLDIHSIDIYGE